MNTLDLAELLATVRNLKAVIRSKYKAREICLFGSSARGESHTDSDIDFLVDFEQGADLFDLIGLAAFLEDTLGRKVDLVSKRALRSELRKSILAEAIII